MYVQEAADWGTFVHRWKATGECDRRGGWDELLRNRIRLSGINRELLWPSSGRHEVAMAVDCTRWGRAAEFRGTKEEVDAWRNTLSDEWIAGEADYVGDLLGEPWVDDLKTGRVAPDPSFLQGKVYALGAYFLSPMEADRVHVSVTHWPRYPQSGRPRQRFAVWTVRDLKRFHGELVRGRNRALKRLPVAVVGEQCTYCDCKTSCPEFSRGGLTGK